MSCLVGFAALLGWLVSCWCVSWILSAFYMIFRWMPGGLDAK